MTLHELRLAGFAVFGEKKAIHGGTMQRVVLVRCGCYRMCWAQRRTLIQQAKKGEGYRCSVCGTLGKVYPLKPLNLTEPAT